MWNVSGLWHLPSYICKPTELFWMLWPLAAATEIPPLKQRISSGRTHRDLFATTVEWRLALTTERERVCFQRRSLISGNVGSPPLESCHWAHSDSGTDWCFSLEKDCRWSSSWCNAPAWCWPEVHFLSLSAGLGEESDWSPVKGPSGSGWTSLGVHLDSVKICPLLSGRSV